jgi:Nitrile hydratase, alpha chain
METQTLTRRELETALIEKCWKDPEFKKQVVSDPKGMLERHTGKKLPPEVKIFIHEEDANKVHFSIPPAPAKLAELSDVQLEQVAGGQAMIPIDLSNPDPLLTLTPQNPTTVGGW